MAFHYSKMAAEQGNVSAIFNIGTFYANGTGVTKDMMEAVRYYKLAADLNHAGAQYKLCVR